MIMWLFMLSLGMHPPAGTPVADTSRTACSGATGSEITGTEFSLSQLLSELTSTLCSTPTLVLHYQRCSSGSASWE